MTIFRLDTDEDMAKVVNPRGKRKLDQLAILESLKKFGIVPEEEVEFVSEYKDILTPKDAANMSEAQSEYFNATDDRKKELREMERLLFHAGQESPDSRIIDRTNKVGVFESDPETLEVRDADYGEVKGLTGDLLEANRDNVAELQRSSPYIKELMSDSPEAMAALGMSPAGKNKIPTEELNQPSSPQEREWWESQGHTGDKELVEGTGAGTGKRPKLSHTKDTRSKGLQEEFDAYPEYAANQEKYNQKILNEDGSFRKWLYSDEEVAQMAEKQEAADMRAAVASASDPDVFGEEVDAEDLVETKDGAYEVGSEEKVAVGSGGFSDLEGVARSVAEKIFGKGVDQNAVEDSFQETQKWKDISAAGVPLLSKLQRDMSRNPHRGKSENRKAMASALKSGSLQDLRANREIYDDVALEGADLRQIEQFKDMADDATTSFKTVTKLENDKVGNRKKMAAEAFGAMSDADFYGFGKDQQDYLDDNKNVNIEYQKEMQKREAAKAQGILDMNQRDLDEEEQRSRIDKNNRANKKGKGKKKEDKGAKEVHKNLRNEAQKNTGRMNSLFQYSNLATIGGKEWKDEADAILKDLGELQLIKLGENPVVKMDLDGDGVPEETTVVEALNQLNQRASKFMRAALNIENMQAKAGSEGLFQKVFGS